MRDTTAAAKTLAAADDLWLQEVVLRDPAMIRDVAVALLHVREHVGPGCGATDCVNTCDGEHAADVFPYGAGRDAAHVKDRARYMVETLNASNHQQDLIAYLEKVTEHFDREAEGETVTCDPAALYAEGIVCLRRLSLKPQN